MLGHEDCARKLTGDDRIALLRHFAKCSEPGAAQRRQIATGLGLPPGFVRVLCFLYLMPYACTCTYFLTLHLLFYSLSICSDSYPCSNSTLLYSTLYITNSHSHAYSQ